VIRNAMENDRNAMEDRQKLAKRSPEIITCVSQVQNFKPDIMNHACGGSGLGDLAVIPWEATGHGQRA
jgi:hypothetical protein